MTFEYQYLPTIEDVHKEIINCEGRHSQTVSFSTFHNALTQVCFGCKKVRSNLRRIYERTNNGHLNELLT